MFYLSSSPNYGNLKAFLRNVTIENTTDIT